MRTASLIAGSLLTASTLALSAPLALADSGGTASNVTPFGFQIDPTTAAPGGNIGLGVSDCDAGSATASSSILGTVKLPSTGTKGEYVGAATLGANAKPGKYAVKFTCGSSSGTTTLTVSGTTTTSASATATAVPNGAVKTGLGGGSTSMSPAETAAGAALVGVALIGGVAISRRRNARHQ